MRFFAFHVSVYVGNGRKEQDTLILIAVLRFNHFSLGSEGLNVWHLLLGDEALEMSHSP